MKKILLLVAVFAIAGIVKLQAQCAAANLQVVIKNVTAGTNGCQVTLDVSFTADFNNGNKFAFVHLWETAPVNNYPNLTYVNPPTAAELTNAIATLVIVDPGKNSAALYNQYPSNTAVPVKYSGITFTKSGTLYSMTNVVINFSTCNVPVTVKGDVWASQSDLSQVVHCENDGIITILFNNPIITGSKQCATPRKLNIAFENEHATLSESVVASVYIDANNNGTIDAADINITNSLSPALPNPISLTPNSQQSFNGLSYTPYSSQAQYDGYPIIVRANATAPGAATVTITKAGINFQGNCSLLPVTFTSFTAKRDQSAVALQWETSSELNNSGFALERGVNGVWTELAFIPSRAPGGNSNSKLVYTYDDINTIRTISYYRIKQIDFNGVFKYSEVRSVTGENQKAKTTVYPNPSNNGKVNVVFEESDDKQDVVLVDMTGRLVKQWKAVRNNIQINNLTPGIYHLRIVNSETGNQSIEKIVVSNN
ncbi:MAG TPA: T9SS type A sorting domain-containing protein [Chitinophagaceae bacterium]|nr:T9SS type A sorting domain-containing protein [Chitinophagaceae bacterium]